MYEYQATIRSIYDGDTCRADVDLGFSVWISDMSLRLYGIDAPELGKPGGKEARDFLRDLMPVGSTVTIRTRKDATEKYGRMLAEIWDAQAVLGDDDSINLRMVAANHAVPYFGGPR